MCVQTRLHKKYHTPFNGAESGRKRQTIEISWISNRSISINNMQQQRWRQQRGRGREREKESKKGDRKIKTFRVHKIHLHTLGRSLTHATRYCQHGNGIESDKIPLFTISIVEDLWAFLLFCGSLNPHNAKWFHFHLLENISFWAPFAGALSVFFVFIPSLRFDKTLVSIFDFQFSLPHKSVMFFPFFVAILCF